MKKLFDCIKKRRDKRFLRRLERLLNENILEAGILFRGSVGGTYDYIYRDVNRGCQIDGQAWKDHWRHHPRKEFGQGRGQ